MPVYQKLLSQTNVFSTKGRMPFAGCADRRKIASDLIADREGEGEISLTKLQKQVLSSSR